MNRVIEFRVWDTLLRKMMADQPYINFDNKEYVFMQFTGLYDYKRNKIFEGDVLEMRGTKARYTVQFNPVNACFMLDGRFMFHKDVHPKDFEVIGNIFENS